MSPSARGYPLGMGGLQGGVSRRSHGIPYFEGTWEQ